MEFCKCRIEFILAFLITIALTALPQYSPTTPESIPPVVAAVPAVPQLEVVEGTIQKNTTLVATLVDLEVPVAVANQLATLIQPVFDVRKLRWGNLFRLEKETDGTVHAFEYKIDDERVLKVEKADDAYAAKVETLEFETRQSELTAEIQTSLYEALDDYPKGHFLAIELADKIFAWDVDFDNDIQKGDRIELVVDEQYHNGQFVKYGRIHAAKLVNSGAAYEAYLFRDDYYDGKGNAVRRGFLRSPLQFTRVSSGFSRRRVHPILGTARAHLAVDYAAPTGTPVHAVANGTVTVAGTNGGYGRMVELRHTNGLRTGYAHLSRIAVRSGQVVKQGDVIGAVGQTGLATGPHLHYMVSRDGTAINPLTIESEPPTPIDPKLKPEFLAYISGWQNKLAGGLQTASR